MDFISCQVFCCKIHAKITDCKITREGVLTVRRSVLNVFLKRLDKITVNGKPADRYIKNETEHTR